MSGCVWGQGECVPNCPSCRRMDELVAERSAGYREGLRDAKRAIRGVCLHDDDEEWCIFVAAIEALET